MKIFYLAADTGACGHYRCELPAEGLRALGHDVTVATRTWVQPLVDSDVVVGQRVASEVASRTWQYLAGNRPAAELPPKLARPKLVYELDDDVWALQHEKSNPAAGTWAPLLRNVEANLAVSDAVTVSTAPLAEVVRQHTDAPVHVVPNAIPDAVVDETQAYANGVQVFNIPGILGWGGSQTHDADWEEAARPVARWAQRNDSPLVLFGGVPGPLRKELLRHGDTLHRVEPWIRGDWNRYYRTLRYQVDVGLAPLAASEFNRSKSDLRLLEFAALGIPWVASDFGPYGASEDASGGDARGGRVVTTPHGWAGALDRLQDPGYRVRRVDDGLAWARTRTVSAVAPLWERALS